VGLESGVVKGGQGTRTGARGGIAANLLSPPGMELVALLSLLFLFFPFSVLSSGCDLGYILGVSLLSGELPLGGGKHIDYVMLGYV
jgi:hypothetical protein